MIKVYLIILGYPICETSFMSVARLHHAGYVCAKVMYKDKLAITIDYIDFYY